MVMAYGVATNEAVMYQVLNKKNNLEQVIDTYAPLVKRIAHHLLGRLPPNIQVDDMVQSGMIGLIEAAKSYDPDKGASFQTFAGIRIRGAMLDEIRRGDWAPRSVHRNSRRVSEAIHQVECQTGRDPSPQEIANEMGVSLDEYHRILQDSNSSKIIGFEDLGVTEDALRPANSHTDEPPTEVDNKRLQQFIKEGIKHLPQREALVLALYYNEDLNLREVGEILEVSESRVSQIHSQAMCRLRAKLSHIQGGNNG